MQRGTAPHSQRMTPCMEAMKGQINAFIQHISFMAGLTSTPPSMQFLRVFFSIIHPILSRIRRRLFGVKKKEQLSNDSYHGVETRGALQYNTKAKCSACRIFCCFLNPKDIFVVKTTVLFLDTMFPWWSSLLFGSILGPGCSTFHNVVRKRVCVALPNQRLSQ